MENLIKDILKHTSDCFNSGMGKEGYGCDLHHELYNTVEFIDDGQKAIDWFGDQAFPIIKFVKDYEISMMGEVHTDFSNPKHVANMFAYFVGEQLLMFSEHLNDVVWEKEMTPEDYQTIREEIGSTTADELLWTLDYSVKAAA